MNESSDSLFFRATTEIWAGWDALVVPIRVVTVTILEVLEILCSFRLLLDGKTVVDLTELSRLSSQKRFLQTILLFCGRQGVGSLN